MGLPEEARQLVPGPDILPELYDTSKCVIAPWAPQPQILGHQNCKLFVTHCGFGSLGDAALAGMPLVGLPFFAEQPQNAALVERRGWGKRATSSAYHGGWPGADQLLHTISEVLGDPQMQRVAKEMQDGAVRSGGASRAVSLLSE